MVPSLKTLERLRGAAEKCTRGSADEILQCLRFAMQRRSPGRALAECNALLDGFGIEYIFEGGQTHPSTVDGSDALIGYVNLGDTYCATIVYDYKKQRFEVTSWGNWYEASGEADRNRGE